MALLPGPRTVALRVNDIDKLDFERLVIHEKFHRITAYHPSYTIPHELERGSLEREWPAIQR